MQQGQDTPPRVTGFLAALSPKAISERLPEYVKNTSAHWAQGETWGVLSYATSAFCSSLMMITVKFGHNAGFSTWELLMARSLLLAAVCVVKLRISDDKVLGQRDRRPLLCLRGALGCCSVTALFFATQKLPIADVTVFSFLAPVIVAVLSPIFLRESSQGVWVSIAGCSIGVLLVAQPGFVFGTPRLSLFGVGLGILHSTASGTAKMCVRALREEVTHVKMLYLAMCSILLSGAGILVTSPRLSMPSWYECFVLFSCGAWGYGVQVFMTLGLERARAAKAMTMAYTSIVWTELAGIFMFKEVPNSWAVLGVAVIIVATYHNSQAKAPGPVVPMFQSSAGSSLLELLPTSSNPSTDNEAILQVANGESIARSRSTSLDLLGARSPVQRGLSAS